MAFELLDLPAYLEQWAHNFTRFAPPTSGDLTFNRTGALSEPAALATLRLRGREARLIVWSNGEADLSMGFPGDPCVNEHHQLSDHTEVNSLLDRMSVWLGSAEDPAGRSGSQP